MNYLSKLSVYFLNALGGILIAKNIISEKINKKVAYLVLIVIVYGLISSIVHIDNNRPVQTLINLLILSLSIKSLFDMNVILSFLYSIMTIMLTVTSRLVIRIIIYLISPILVIESNSMTFFILSLIVIIITFFISRVNYVKENINEFIIKIENQSSKHEIITIVLLISIIIFFNYQLSFTRYVDGDNANFIIFIIVLFVVGITYFRETLKYYNIINKYNDFISYSCMFEEEIENEKLLNHEYKNQLAVIRDMTKSKKITNYIDSILNNYDKNSCCNVKGINNLPKGGLRGVIYYKLSVIKSKNIKFSLDISKSIKDKIKDLSPEYIKVLSYILGVCCDNAIEECVKSEDSNLSIEIYYLNNCINIIIANTIFNKIKMDNVGDKGYTTKGKGRGNGLFLINKLIKKYDNVYMTTKIINNYYIQEVKIGL